MPEPTEPAKTPSTKTASADLKSAEQGYEDEIARLRAQVRDLQSELARRPGAGTSSRSSRRWEDEDEDERGRRGSSRDFDREERPARRGNTPDDVMRETADVFREIPARAIDQASKLIRGFAFAYLQQLQGAAEVVSSFTDEVFRRNRPEQSSRGRDDDRDRDDERSSARSRYDESRGDDRYDDRYESRYEARYENSRSYDDRGGESDDRERGRRRDYDRGESRGQERGGRRSENRETVAGLAANLPRDLYSGLIKAVDRSLDIPTRAVDRFYESYQESNEAEPTFERQRSRREERGGGGRRDDEYDEERDRDRSRSISFEAGREGDEGGKAVKAELRTSKREG